MLLSALADAIGVYYNATGELECFSPAAGANNASSVDANNWNWQVRLGCELVSDLHVAFRRSRYRIRAPLELGR